MSSADKTVCCWIFHSDISYHVSDQLFILKYERADIKFVRLARDN